MGILPGMVPWSTRLLYAAPALGLAALGIPLYVHLPKFTTDVVGVDVGLVGAALLLARVFDAVTDPLAGYLSDRTRTRWGRRRPYIALGGLALAFSLGVLFVPPTDGAFASGALAAWRFVGALLLVFAAWTAVVVPYEALGNELSEDFDERTAVLGLRDGALLVGTLVASAVPGLLVWGLDLPETNAGERTKFFWLAAIYGVLIAALCLLCAVFVPERGKAQGQGGFLSPAEALRTLRANPPFAALLASYTVNAIGSNLPATLLLYYVAVVLQAPQAEPFLLAYFLTGIALMPAWPPLSRKIGKKEAYVLACAVNIGAFVWAYNLGPGDGLWFGLICVASGVGFGGTVILPSSMQADVIDYDELLTGERREGHYVGLWNVSRKLAAALGVGVALPLMQLAGYVPGATTQPEAVAWTLRALYAAVPSVCALAALGIVWRYRLDRAAHDKILLALAARRRGETVADPLHPGVLLGPLPVEPDAAPR
ncbi:MAG: hypothetical protein RIT28_1101 [Pseudomonadota bacterium]